MHKLLLTEDFGTLTVRAPDAPTQKSWVVWPGGNISSTARPLKVGILILIPILNLKKLKIN